MARCARKLANDVPDDANRLRKLANHVRDEANCLRKLTNDVRDEANGVRKLTNRVRDEANGVPGCLRSAPGDLLQLLQVMDLVSGHLMEDPVDGQRAELRMRQRRRAIDG